jgi:hypothetical protein
MNEHQGWVVIILLIGILIVLAITSLGLADRL